MSHDSWFVDTGHWIAPLNRGDPLHARARRLNATLRGRLITTEAVLTEVGNWMAGLSLRALATAFFLRVRANPHVDIVPVDLQLFARAVALYTSRSGQGLGPHRLHLVRRHAGLRYHQGIECRYPLRAGGLPRAASRLTITTCFRYGANRLSMNRSCAHRTSSRTGLWITAMPAMLQDDSLVPQ